MEERGKLLSKTAKSLMLAFTLVLQMQTKLNVNLLSSVSIMEMINEIL